MQSRTLVIGANGLVGRVLVRGLAGLPMTFTDRSRLDVSDPLALRREFAGHEQVVHLASPRRRPMWTQEDFDASLCMVRDVLDAAAEAGVKRLVLPSSVLATSNAQLRGTTKVSVADTEPPDSEFGRSRLLVEGLGRKAAANGMEVVCIRLGTVRHPDAPVPRPELRNQWLSHEDCVALFRACLGAPEVPGRFSLFYAVSDLPERVLDTANPFAWAPRTQRVGFRRSVRAALYRLNTGIRGRLRIRTRLQSILRRRYG